MITKPDPTTTSPETGPHLIDGKSFACFLPPTDDAGAFEECESISDGAVNRVVEPGAQHSDDTDGNEVGGGPGEAMFLRPQLECLTLLIGQCRVEIDVAPSALRSKFVVTWVANRVRSCVARISHSALFAFSERRFRFCADVDHFVECLDGAVGG